jgi:5'-3' exonuclease
MIDDKFLCTQFYPTDFKIDAASGFKTQYSEAILPEIDDELLIEVVKKYELKLTPEEKIRNTISEKPKMS